MALISISNKTFLHALYLFILTIYLHLCISASGNNYILNMYNAFQIVYNGSKDPPPPPGQDNNSYLTDQECLEVSIMDRTC